MKKLISLFFVLMLALNISACSSGGGGDTPILPSHSIEGTINVDSSALWGDAATVAGITVKLTGASSATTTTDANGKYKFSNIKSGDYTITPQATSGYTFVPASINVTIGLLDVTVKGKNFTGTKVSASLFLHYTMPDQYNFLTNYPGKTVADEPAILFSAYTLTTGIDYGKGTLVSGYALDQFVDKAAVNAATPDPEGVLGTNDARKLYSVVVRSNQDGFSNRSKFVSMGMYNADLIWDMFSEGYLLDLTYDGKVHYPASVAAVPTQVKMFNIKYAYDLYMFRKIDVKRPDAAGSLATFEVTATTDNYVDDTTFTTSTTLTTTKFSVTTISFGDYKNVRAIPLKQFLTDYVTDTPGSYTYKVIALDGTAKDGWTYANMQQAYYLPDFDIICRVSGGSLVAGTKVNFPIRIELIGTSVEYDYSAKNPPAYAKAYEEE